MPTPTTPAATERPAPPTPLIRQLDDEARRERAEEIAARIRATKVPEA